MHSVLMVRTATELIRERDITVMPSAPNRISAEVLTKEMLLEEDWEEVALEHHHSYEKSRITIPQKLGTQT